MKELDFHAGSRCQSWDQYEAFHVRHPGGFVQFATGEFMLTEEPKIHHRRIYEELGIELASTADNQFSFYLDKECTEAIPQAWITQSGQQHIAIDYEQKVVTRIKNHKYVWSKGKPTAAHGTKRYLAKHLSRAAALWMGPERLPLALHQMNISRPAPELRKSLDAKLLGEVKNVVTATCRIRTDLQAMRCWTQDKVLAEPKWAGMTTPEIIEDLAERPLDMVRIAKNGIAYPRAETSQDFIYIK